MSVFDRLRTGGIHPPTGSRGELALRELQKLPAMIEAKRAQWDAADPVSRLHLEREINSLESQFARHVQDLGDFAPGRGFVAAEGTKRARVQLSEAKELPLTPIDPSTFHPDVQKVMTEGNSWVHMATEWTATELKGLPVGEYFYVVRDSEDGILKFGKTSHTETGSPLNVRMYDYMTAARETGRTVQVELHFCGTVRGEIPEGILRAKHWDSLSEADRPSSMRWDHKAPHRDGTFGPGTPHEKPKGYSQAKVVEVLEGAPGGKQRLVVEHADKHNDNKPHRQTIEWDPVERGVRATVNQTLEKVPNRYLYEWSGVADQRNPRLVTRETAGAPPPKEPSSFAKFKMKPEADRKIELESLLRAHRIGNDAAKSVVAAAKALGIDRSTMYALLAKHGISASKILNEAP